MHAIHVACELHTVIFSEVWGFSDIFYPLFQHVIVPLAVTKEGSVHRKSNPQVGTLKATSKHSNRLIISGVDLFR